MYGSLGALDGKRIIFGQWLRARRTAHDRAAKAAG
jgi:hypothetical protein